MKILVSNDDGVNAPGIKALADELANHADVVVMAPDRNRSGASNSLTLHQPIRARKLENGYYSIEGTPTDCVHLGLTGFIQPNADMVVSGINEGANLGDDTLYSGTVAAAVEGRYLGLPAIAVSMVGRRINNYQTAAKITASMVMRLKDHRLPSQTILNINVPDCPLSDIKGIEVTRLGTRHNAEPIIEQTDPRGRQIFWIGPPGGEADSGPGTDFEAISRGYVSVTPMHLDMTHYKLFDQLSSWMENVSW